MGMRVAEQVRAQVLALAAGSGTVRAHAEHGLQHRLMLRFEGAWDVGAGQALMLLLPGYPLIIPGHRVAEATIADVDHRHAEQLLTLTVELLLEEVL